MTEPSFAPMTCPTCGKQTDAAISVWRCGCGEELHGPEIDVDLRAAYERGVREAAEAAARVAAETRAKIVLLRPEHAEQRSYLGAEIVGAETAEGRILALLDKEGGGDG